MRLAFLHLVNFKAFYGEVFIDFLDGLNVTLGGNAQGKSCIVDALLFLVDPPSSKALIRAKNLAEVINSVASASGLDTTTVDLCVRSDDAARLFRRTLSSRNGRSVISSFSVAETAATQPMPPADVLAAATDWTGVKRAIFHDLLAAVGMQPARWPIFCIPQSRIAALAAADPASVLAFLDACADVQEPLAAIADADARIAAALSDGERLAAAVKETQLTLAALVPAAREAQEHIERETEAQRALAVAHAVASDVWRHCVEEIESSVEAEQLAHTEAAAAVASTSLATAEAQQTLSGADAASRTAKLHQARQQARADVAERQFSRATELAAELARLSASADSAVKTLEPLHAALAHARAHTPDAHDVSEALAMAAERERLGRCLVAATTDVTAAETAAAAAEVALLKAVQPCGPDSELAASCRSAQASVFAAETELAAAEASLLREPSAAVPSRSASSQRQPSPPPSPISRSIARARQLVQSCRHVLGPDAVLGVLSDLVAVSPGAALGAGAVLGPLVAAIVVASPRQALEVVQRATSRVTCFVLEQYTEARFSTQQPSDGDGDSITPLFSLLQPTPIVPPQHMERLAGCVSSLCRGFVLCWSAAQAAAVSAPPGRTPAVTTAGAVFARDGEISHFEPVPWPTICSGGERAATLAPSTERKADDASASKARQRLSTATVAVEAAERRLAGARAALRQAQAAVQVEQDQHNLEAEQHARAESVLRRSRARLAAALSARDAAAAALDAAPQVDPSLDLQAAAAALVNLQEAEHAACAAERQLSSMRRRVSAASSALADCCGGCSLGSLAQSRQVLNVDLAAAQEHSRVTESALASAQIDFRAASARLSEASALQVASERRLEALQARLPTARARLDQLSHFNLAQPALPSKVASELRRLRRKRLSDQCHAVDLALSAAQTETEMLLAVDVDRGAPERLAGARQALEALNHDRAAVSSDLECARGERLAAASARHAKVAALVTAANPPLTGYLSALSPGASAILQCPPTPTALEAGVGFSVRPDVSGWRPGHHLSGGQAAVAALALAFALRNAAAEVGSILPSVLFLDEPDAALDTTTAIRFADFLCLQRGQIVVVSHRPELWEAAQRLHGVFAADPGSCVVSKDVTQGQRVIRDAPAV
jgi:chromosome segregation ATPase